MTASKEQIPVFLLTGFLGAGKTTLINRILEDPKMKDTALIINEFGLVPVDHDLVREGREMPMVTTTGCICCTVGSDLRSSLNELLEGRRKGDLPPFSRVIVETTGMADPAPIVNSLIPGGVQAFSLSDHAVARAFRLSGVITVVDVEGIGTALGSHKEALKQIAFADHVVLTRTDRTPAGDWPAKLLNINPGLRIHDAADPKFHINDLLQGGSYSAFGKGEGVAEWLEAETGGAAHAGHGGHFDDLNRHGNVLAVPLTGDEPVDEAALRQFLTKITMEPGNGLLRIKGLMALKDDPSRPAVVHAVQHRLYPFLRLDAWPFAQSGNRLVVIGTNLDEAKLRKEFAALTETPKPFSLAGFSTLGGTVK